MLDRSIMPLRRLLSITIICAITVMIEGGLDRMVIGLDDEDLLMIREA